MSEVPELYFSINLLTDRIPGDFDPGIQPRGTLITAEVVHSGDVDINVTWRDGGGRVVSGSWCKSSGWDVPNPNGGRLLDGRN